MSEIVLGEPLASEIRATAKAQGLGVEDLLEAALRHYRFEAQNAKIDREQAWWGSNSAETTQQYRGEFVAVHEQQVVDHDPDEEVLLKRIRAKYGNVAILVTPAEGQREWHMLSTHIERP